MEQSGISEKVCFFSFFFLALKINETLLFRIDSQTVRWLCGDNLSLIKKKHYHLLAWWLLHLEDHHCNAAGQLHDPILCKLNLIILSWECTLCFPGFVVYSVIPVLLLNRPEKWRVTTAHIEGHCPVIYCISNTNHTALEVFPKRLVFSVQFQMQQISVHWIQNNTNNNLPKLSKSLLNFCWTFILCMAIFSSSMFWRILKYTRYQNHCIQIMNAVLRICYTVKSIAH